MHPIEHLRYVARARGADPVSLVRETAAALSGLGHEPAGIVLAARRIVQRHPTCGPLWWLCSHVLGALDPFVAMGDCEEEIKNDWHDEEWYKMYPGDLCFYKYPDEVIEEFKNGVNILRKAAIYVHRIDYLLSGDDGNESFIERLKNELSRLENASCQSVKE